MRPNGGSLCLKVGGIHRVPNPRNPAMVVAIAGSQDYSWRMTTLGITELEELLRAANETVVRLTLANTTLTSDLNHLQRATKKLKRKSRSNERDFKDQLATALRGR